MWGKESLAWGSQACISLCYMRRGEGRDRGDVSSNIIMEAEQSPNTHTHTHTHTRVYAIHAKGKKYFEEVGGRGVRPYRLIPWLSAAALSAFTAGGISMGMMRHDISDRTQKGKEK